MADPAGASPPPLVPATGEEVAEVLAYALRHDERGKPRRGATWEVAAAVLAEQLAAHMERANMVAVKKPPRPPHST
ncbi:hypothetical protein D9599_28665 [Roseomonas sp. KE2513]|uniref:hypothetical protein n=1 Tax=Roseomonas sp. KE2513 TaxID=2479202 RepID=UPI0018DFD5C8|nr:hypothetical protein [Roseomonas sp. KE2513]MBI0539492.1 hypothetical protein [Roseomonas sp. KE2513]